MRIRRDDGFTILVIFPIVLVIFTLVYFGWFFNRNAQLTKQLQTTAAQKADPYAGWQTYMSPDHTFSLRHPAEWGLAKSSAMNCQGDSVVVCKSFYVSYKDVPIQIVESRTVVAATNNYGLHHSSSCPAKDSRFDTVAVPIDGHYPTYIHAQNTEKVTICQAYEFWVGNTDLQLIHLEDVNSVKNLSEYFESVSPQTFNQIVRSVRFH